MGRIGGGIALLAAIAVVAGQHAAAGGDPAAERALFASHTVQLCYDVVSGGDVEATSVELWMTRDGGRTWSIFTGTRTEVRPDGQGCLTIALPEDGEYGLKVVAVDEDGAAEARPVEGEPPALIAVVDTLAPDVRILAPQPGDWEEAGGRLRVQWACSDALSDVDDAALESSADGGATWTSVAEGLPPRGERDLDLPTSETPDFRVRLRARDGAGNVGATALPRGVVVFAPRPPEEPERFSSATLPPTRSNRREFDIEYAVEDVASAGLQAVVLWWTSDGGSSWHCGGRDEDLASPFRFLAPEDGTYGFVLQAIDNAHRASVPDPVPGAPAHRVTIVDTAPPELRLVSPVGGHLVAGQPCRVEWSSSDANFGPTPIRLVYSVDGGTSWSPMTSDPLPSTGGFDWSVPRVVSACVRVKAIAADMAENASESVSDAIHLVHPESEPPKAVILGVRPAQPVPLAEVRQGPPPDPPPATAEPTLAAPDSAQEVVEPVAEAQSPPPEVVEPTPQAQGPPPGVVEPPPAPPDPPPPSRPRGEAYERGKLLAAQGKAPEARDAFIEELASYPDHVEAANDLGVVLTELRDVAGAVEAFRQAKGIDASDPEVRFNLAGALLAARRPSEAIREGVEALSALPKQGDLALRFLRLLWKSAIAALEADDLPSARGAWGAIAALDRPDNRWKDPAAEMLRRYGK